MRRSVLAAAALGAVVTLLAFLPVLDNRFVTWEDALTITGNPNITAITPGFFRWAFFHQHGLFWMPLTWVSLALDYRLWGLNPYGFHLTNLVVHTFNTFLVSLLTAELLRGREAAPDEASVPPKLLPLAALVVGLFFGLHPLRVEAVAWASERKGLLNAIFVLPALLLYLRYVRRPAADSPSMGARLAEPRYLASLVFFILSLLCKPMTVTLPVVLLILDRFHLGRFGERRPRLLALGEKIPFFAASAVVSVITLALKPPGDITLTEISLWSRLHVGCRALMAYLRLTVWPSDLMALYDHPANSVPVASVTFWWPVVAVVAISCACLAVARRCPAWPSLWLTYTIVLLPVLGFTQTGGQSMADRFTYLPAIALGLPVVAGFCRIWGVGSARPWPARGAILALGIAVVTALGLTSRGLIGSWHDTETLWSHAISVRPSEAGRACYQRGMEYLERGEFGRALADADGALAILGRIGYTRIGKVYELRAMANEGLGRPEEAARDYEMVRRLPSAWSTPR